MPAFDLSGLGWTAELASSLEAKTVAGRIAVQHRGAYVAYTELGELRVRLPGRLLHAGVQPAVGDWVALDGETIVAVLPRRSAFVRNAAGRSTEAQVLAEAIAFGVPVHVVSAVTGEGCEEIAAYLRPGVTAVLLGSSGVGKSTLVNRLAGVELLRTRPVREDDGAGRHTTTHRELVLLPGGGMLIDTPGLRELQLWDGGDGGFEETFADVEELAPGCRFSDCSHTREPGCAVLAAVDEGVLPLDRLRSYRKLQRELRRNAARRGDARARAERRKEIRKFSRSLRKDSW